ncbi:hypothetical protein BCR33DRAFT_858440 [Rhizoclosmatium globosum]|uniref:Carbohydrate-binding module family 19 domain-containing protein n=1 Tax=Rhizoclosmatium globosum TaxID=329046 RepID=A0A1Y2AYE1_9FUNG|nr:hypothetical protein BCR33DRAFT_858440 [Rhizoclosmatium globosum]|eukprot:ORY27613.1 hypothetical protein BCR33DRAFT_858440 [Rhizoclosmatium globosum]
MLLLTTLIFTHIVKGYTPPISQYVGDTCNLEGAYACSYDIIANLNSIVACWGGEVLLIGHCTGDDNYDCAYFDNSPFMMPYCVPGPVPDGPPPDFVIPSNVISSIITSDSPTVQSIFESPSSSSVSLNEPSSIEATMTASVTNSSVPQSTILQSDIFQSFLSESSGSSESAANFEKTEAPTKTEGSTSEIKSELRTSTNILPTVTGSESVIVLENSSVSDSGLE